MEKDFRPPPFSPVQMKQSYMNSPPQPPAPYPPPAGPQAAPYHPPPYPDPYQRTPIVIHTVSQVSSLTDVPGRVVCPHCLTEVLTRTESVSGLLTWLVCGSLVLFLCWLCCCIPFCINSCKDVKHTCPNCKNVVRIYKRLQ